MLVVGDLSKIKLTPNLLKSNADDIMSLKAGQEGRKRLTIISTCDMMPEE
jgi:hypothetical protein